MPYQIELALLKEISLPHDSLRRITLDTWKPRYCSNLKCTSLHININAVVYTFNSMQSVYYFSSSTEDWTYGQAHTRQMFYCWPIFSYPPLKLVLWDSLRVLGSLCNSSRAWTFSPTTLASQVAELILFFGSYYKRHRFKISGSDNKYNI